MDKEKLFSENTNLAYFILKKYYTPSSQDEDFKQLALLGLWKACLYYEEDKGIAFTTYAAKIIYNELGNYIKYTRRHNNNLEYLSLDKERVDEDDLNLSEVIGGAPWDDDLVLYDFNDRLSERESSILGMKILGYSQEEIAGVHDISQAHVCRTLKKIKNKWISYDVAK